MPVPASAQATEGYVGGWDVLAFCGDRGTFGMAAMDITASVATAPPGTSTSGAQRLQWFAWQATLLYAPPGGAWSVAGTASWRIGQVSDAISNPLSNANNWYDFGTGKWYSGWPSWTLNSPGTYGIRLNMWWYADALSAAGHVDTWAPVTDGVQTGWFCNHS